MGYSAWKHHYPGAAEIPAELGVRVAGSFGPWAYLTVRPTWIPGDNVRHDADASISQELTTGLRVVMAESFPLALAPTTRG